MAKENWCGCQLHFGHHGEEWVLSCSDEDGWRLARYEPSAGWTARIELGGSEDEDPTSLAERVQASLPRRPGSSTS